MFSNMKVSIRLALDFAVVIAPLIALSFMSIQRMAHLNELTRAGEARAVGPPVPASREASAVAKKFNSSTSRGVSAVFGLSLAGARADVLDESQFSR